MASAAGGGCAQSPVRLDAQDAGYGTLTESLSGQAWDSAAAATGSLESAHSGRETTATDDAESNATSQDFVDFVEQEIVPTHQGSVGQETLCCTQKPVVQSQEPLAESQESPAESQESLAESQESLAESQESPAESQEPLTQSQEPLTQNQEPLTQSQEPLTQNQEPLTQSQEPLTQSQEPSTLGTLGRLSQLAQVRFDLPDAADQSEFPPFPSLPNSRLIKLGLLPASLAELQAANAPVSIVDPNNRYRMEGPPMPPATDGNSATTSTTVDDRVRELGISFANDAATVGERVKRVSLARASLEVNLAEELNRLEADLLAAGGQAAQLAGSVRVLRDSVARLNRTAEALGAVEQECRLNFAFHLIHKHSDELRTEKERMSGELEIMRQVVEDEKFYANCEASHGRAVGKSGAGPTGKGRAKFQQVGRNVARTTYVAGLLQRLSRERQEHGGRLPSGVAETAGDAADGGFPTSPEEAAAGDFFASSSIPPPISPPAAAGNEENETVLDKLDGLSAKLLADRRVRLVLAPLTLLVALVFLLWAIAYPIVKRLM